MHHELLLALVGHPGDAMEVQEHGVFIRPDAKFLSDPQKAMINQLLQLSHGYITLYKFIQNAQATATCIYIRAIAQGMEMILRQYEDKIVALEAKILTTEIVFPVPQMVYELEEFSELLPQLCKLVKELKMSLHHKTSASTSAQVLNTLHHATRSGFPRVRQRMLQLQQIAHRILFKQMLSWMLYGHIVDHGEFFVKRKAPQDSGKSSIDMENLFALDLDAIPLSYFPIPIANSVFEIGKYMRILSSAADVTPKEMQAIVERTAELAARPEFNAMALEQAVNQVRSHVATRLYTEVVVKSDFVGFFHALKNFFLLSRGEVFQALIERSGSVMSMEPTVKLRDDLNHGIWRPILRDLQLEDDPFASWFSFELPLQSFNFEELMCIDGLVLVACARDPTCRRIQLDHDATTGAVWWNHMHFDTLTFKSTFSVRVMKAEIARRHMALVLDTHGQLQAPAVDENGMWSSAHDRGVLAVECEMTGAQEPNHLAICCRVRCGSQVTERQLILLKMPEDWTLDFEVQYKALTTPSLEVSDKSNRGFVVTVNGVVVLQDFFDMQLAMDLKANGEYWVGLAFGPALRIHRWSFCHHESYDKSKKKKTEPESNATNDNAHWRWKALSMTCNVQWPLRLLVSDRQLRSYNQLFQFCFRLRRAAHAIESTWKSPVLRSNQQLSRTLMKACVLRGHMSFVVRTLASYFQVFEIESAFAKCLDAVQRANDFEKVKKLHENFVAHLIKHCCIHSRAILSAIDKVLNDTWAFVHDVRHKEEKTEALHADRLLLLDQEFRSHVKLLHTFLSSAENTRELLMLLKFNEQKDPSVAD